MDQNNISITIGIPAHNESQNIGKLIDLILTQKDIDFNNLQIIVNCDGCTDNTCDIVRGYKNPKIIAIEDGERHGPGYRQNQIISQSNSDILVLMNADILPIDDSFLQELIFPLLNDNVDLTSAKAIPTKPKNFFQTSLYYSVLMKDEVFESIRDGNNIYTCRGVARAFSKKLYKNFRFPVGVAEDAYSYLYTITSGYKYFFAKRSKVYFVLPDNFHDHRKQSLRFYRSASILSDIFTHSEIISEYRYHKLKMLIALLKMGVRHPNHITFYFLMNIYMIIYSKFTRDNSVKGWETSASTKLVDI